MVEYLRYTLDPSGFVPRAVCGSWTRGEVLLNNVSDLLIALAYLSIPVMLIVLARKRRDFPMSWISAVFAAFIFSCGATHVLEIVLFYHPIYHLAGVVKAVTAISSWFAVLALYKILPTALSLHSPSELQAAIDKVTLSHLGLQDQLARQNTQLAETNRQLRVANEAKSRFLANLSHELRTPMVAILGITEMGLADPNWNSRESLLQIRQAALTQNNLVSDLLEFSALASGELKLQDDRFRIIEMMESVTQHASEQAKERGLRLLVEVEPRIASETLRGDRSRLRQVVVHLLDNALKFTSRGGEVRLGVRLAELTPDRARLRLSVSDTGPGIPLSRQSDIFDPFVQLDDSLTKKESGSGLGLPLCRELLHLLGSELELESQVGRGSIFSFEISYPRVFDSLSSLVTQPARVLLVEDNPINRAVMEAILRKSGHSVASAAKGGEALDLAREAEFDLALVDLNLPDMDGFALAKLLQQQVPDLPLMALTAHGEAAYRDRAFSVGMRDFLVKPVSTEYLLSSMERVLRGAEQEGS